MCLELFKKSIVPIESKFKLLVFMCSLLLKNLSNKSFCDTFSIIFGFIFITFTVSWKCLLKKLHENCPRHFEPPSPRLPNCWNSHLGHTQLGNLVTYYGYGDVRDYWFALLRKKNLEWIPKLVVLGFGIFLPIYYYMNCVHFFLFAN